MPRMKKSSWLATTLVYAVIVFEILYMISPFALHFYSVYGPALNALHRSPATSWLTGFFLPHVSHTSSVLLGALHEIGRPILLVGMILFAIAFVQIYWAKFTKRGAVTGGLYRFTRHPQYIALAIAGFGLVLIWPRFLIALTYTVMLWMYVLLARHEERLCVSLYRDSYRAYLGRDPKPIAPLRAAVALIVVIASTLAVAFALREKTLSSISAVWRDDVAIISPAQIDARALEHAFSLAHNAAPASGRLLATVVPESWFLADLPIDNLSVEEWRRRHGHDTPRDFDRTKLKVLLAEPRTHDAAARGKQIVRSAWGRKPLAVVHVDLAQNKVIEVSRPPAHVLWGDIPTPLF